MAGNNFKLFDENRQNMLSDQEYNDSQQRLSGVQAGIASSMLNNKFSYQMSLVAYAIAQMMNANGYDATDSLAVSAFVGNLSNSVLQKVIDKATSAEAIAGLNDTKWITPAKVKQFAESHIFTADKVTISQEVVDALGLSGDQTVNDGLLGLNGMLISKRASVLLTQSGTFKFPSNAYGNKATVICVGGGGAGGGDNTTSTFKGGGGGSGRIIIKDLVLTPNAEYEVVIGAGGTNPGGDGGSTIFGDNLVVAAGGNAGTVASGGDGEAGGGGGAEFTANGGNGAVYGGGGGAGGGGGVGGNGGTYGGGGGGATAGLGGQYGGNGGNTADKQGKDGTAFADSVLSFLPFLIENVLGKGGAIYNGYAGGGGYGGNGAYASNSDYGSGGGGGYGGNGGVGGANNTATGGGGGGLGENGRDAVGYGGGGGGGFFGYGTGGNGKQDSSTLGLAPNSGCCMVIYQKAD